MTDRPIPFSAPMIQALLGERKDQTRRILYPQPFIDKNGNFCAPDRKGKIWIWGQNAYGKPHVGNYTRDKVRYNVGDRLWVREAWRTEARFDDRPPIDIPFWALVSYEADYDYEPNDGCRGRYRHARFMPRWASRLTLIVTDVRVERVQDISEDDARAEGVSGNASGPWGCEGLIEDFSNLWDSIHGPGAWDRNDWVVALTFTTHKCNIDQIKGAA